MKKIALLGLGTVGLGCAEILNKRAGKLEKIIGDEITIGKILVKNASKERDPKYVHLLTYDFDEILYDDSIDTILEATGDLEQGYYFIKSAMEKNKNVITANKSVVSKHLEEFVELSRKYNVYFSFEATVGGAIPIIKPLKEETILNSITAVQGILNGTCNYILTRMFNEDLDFFDTLKIAQELGYAEIDPKDDVFGFDTMRKLRILTTIGFNTSVNEKDIFCCGINQITKVDVAYIKAMNSSVKLIARGELKEEGFVAVVEPCVISKDDYFSTVNMVFNSISISGTNFGDLKFYGPGAGKSATGDAVVRDLIDIYLGNHSDYYLTENRPLHNLNDTERGKYYLRTTNFSKEDIENNLKPSSVTFDKENSFYIFEDISRKQLYDYCDLNIKEKENYFIAKIGY